MRGLFTSLFRLHSCQDLLERYSLALALVMVMKVQLHLHLGYQKLWAMHQYWMVKVTLQENLEKIRQGYWFNLWIISMLNRNIELIAMIFLHIYNRSHSPCGLC